MRGYFDGDGCISFGFNRTRKYPRLRAIIVSGSYKFLKEYSRLLNEMDIKSEVYKKENHQMMIMGRVYNNVKYNRLSMSDTPSLKFFHYIYSNPTCLKLERKYKKYLAYLDYRRKYPTQFERKKAKLVRSPDKWDVKKGWKDLTSDKKNK